jgi:hypothetical protein
VITNRSSAARPILFSAQMVRAILDDTKMQTRRVAPVESLNIQSHDNDMTTWGISFTKPVKGVHGSYSGTHCTVAEAHRIIASQFCPYGSVGDRLWVREAFKPCASGQIKNGYGEVRYGFAYRADGATRWNETTTIIHDVTGGPDTGPMQFRAEPWRPSIHMPRRASRIMLEITEARIERLQDISMTDADAEGVRREETDLGRLYFAPDAGANDWSRDPRDAFRDLWESINGVGSWQANPWVWAITFRREQA